MSSIAALSPRGLCHLSLSDQPNPAHEQEMRSLWPRAHWAHDEAAIAATLAAAFGLALILGSIAAAFFVGFVAKMFLLGR